MAAAAAAAAETAAALPAASGSTTTGDLALWGALARRAAFKAALLAETVVWLDRVGGKTAESTVCTGDAAPAAVLAAAVDNVRRSAATAAARWLCADWDASFDEGLAAAESAVGAVQDGDASVRLAPSPARALATTLEAAAQRLVGALRPAARVADAADALCSAVADALEAVCHDSPAALLRHLSSGAAAPAPLTERRVELQAAAGAVVAGCCAARLAGKRGC